jgi:hypothetical protein
VSLTASRNGNAPTSGVTQAALAEQFLTAAVELERRVALKRDRDRRYRINKRNRRRSPSWPIP